MSKSHHESHDGHEPHEMHELPKPEPIASESSVEVIDPSGEAVRAAQEFLKDLRVNFDVLFGELKLARLSPVQLQSFIDQYQRIASVVNEKIDKVRKGLDHPDAVRALIPGYDDAIEGEKLQNLERVKSEARLRERKVNREKERRLEHGDKFFEGIEKADLPPDLVFDALYAADHEMVTQSVLEKMQEPWRVLSPETKIDCFHANRT